MAPKQRIGVGGGGTNLYRSERQVGRAEAKETWSLLFAGGEFADLAGCEHALA